MSSILEALKKLEAEKNAQQVAVEIPEPAYTSDQMAQSLLGNYVDAAPGPRRTSPALLILGGSLFTLLLVGVTVSLAVFVVRNASNAPAPVVATSAPLPLPVEPVAQPSASTTTAPSTSPPMVKTEVPVKAPKELVASTPAPRAKPKPAPEPDTEPLPNIPLVATSTPALSETRYEPYVPKPAAEVARDSAPLPDDIRKLPMLTRGERSKYRLEGLTINMLNEASSTRPLGNALINLEKIFIGETLPGSNATLIDVKSHGIAIEIMSTHQRYYIPR